MATDGKGGAAAGTSSGGGLSGGASSGGASSGGVGGASGGAGGSGGSQGKGSPGCGSASPLKSGNFTETINGTMRKYVLDVPANYDVNKKYKLVFVWHPLGGSASQVVNGGYNGLKSLSEGSAIFVAADGLNGSNNEASGPGWWNVDNGDMLFLTAMLAKLNAGLCVDSDRIFSTGFSFGGMMSYTVGYEFDVFRAIAPCSGDLQVIPHKETYTAPLPIMAFHGDADDFVTTARGRAARDKYLARNKCGTQTVPAAPSPCVEYQGCSAPTFWCEFPGAHMPWSEEPKAIWKFFSQF
jgi:poly(3-hydroxybutyrate) depolymerase